MHEPKALYVKGQGIQDVQHLDLQTLCHMDNKIREIEIRRKNELINGRNICKLLRIWGMSIV
jgi:hypothetical protein